jgi:hypothetical protein
MNGVLDNVKVGDKLIMTSRWNRAILTVEKVQKNFVIAKGYKFRKSSGSLVSSDCWTSASAKIATEEDLEDSRKEVRRQRMISKCRDINFYSLTDTQLEQILKIVNPDFLNGK